MKYPPLIFILLLIAPGLAGAQEPAVQGKTMVYNEVTKESSAFDRAVINAYAGKFRFVDIRASEGFTQGHLKGRPPVFQDPRPMREETKPGKVVVAFLVTPDGRVIEPRIVQSTDQRVASYMLALITPRRYVPARLRGAAVFSLWAEEFVFGSEGRRDNDMFKNGLGIQGNRDR